MDERVNVWIWRKMVQYTMIQKWQRNTADSGCCSQQRMVKSIVNQSSRMGTAFWDELLGAILLASVVWGTTGGRFWVGLESLGKTGGDRGGVILESGDESKGVVRLPVGVTTMGRPRGSSAYLKPTATARGFFRLPAERRVSCDGDI